MPSSHSGRTLVVMFGVALAVLVGGILVSRQVEVVRIDRDRDALRTFAAETQTRIQRLEGLYESHLRRLGASLVGDAAEAGRAAADLEGVLQVSLLHRGAGAAPGFHALVNASPDGPLPLPTFVASASSEVPLVLLDEDRVFGAESGWIDEPGKPLMFHVRRAPDEVAVIAVSRSAVGRSIRGWIAEWADSKFEPLRIGGGHDQLRDDVGVLVGTGDPGPRQPDLLLPLLGRFGMLELASWDERKTVVRYHPVTLAAGSTLSVIVALLAVLVHLSQKRQQQLAVQRVSFVNAVSHELRTPLANIMLNIDLALEMAEETPDQAARRLELVRTEARRLGRLIDNVLTYSRAEKGKLEVKRSVFVPEAVITAAIEQFLPGLERRGLTLERTDEGTGSPCLSDPDALTQILGNLLSNVEKYVPGGRVGIDSRLAEGELVVRVSDEGPGIPADATERVFHPFERLDSRLNDGGSGTGLGLAISRDLAERLGGTLDLLPCEPGVGSCFELRIPAPPATTETTTP